MQGIEFKELTQENLRILDNVRPGTFDNDIRPDQARDFVESKLHRMVVAVAVGQVVGMASGTVILHPDKAPQFFVNEVGVQEEFRRRGIGRQLCQVLIQGGRDNGIDDIWLATEERNAAARGLYSGLSARETTGIVVYDWGHAMDDDQYGNN